jgi:hypothetical protein
MAPHLWALVPVDWRDAVSVQLNHHAAMADRLR